MVSVYVLYRCIYRFWFYLPFYIKNPEMQTEYHPFVKGMACLGAIFSALFMILQLIPIPGLEGVHFGRESYILLIVWIVIGIVFYLTKLQKK